VATLLNVFDIVLQQLFNLAIKTYCKTLNFCVPLILAVTAMKLFWCT